MSQWTESSTQGLGVWGSCSRRLNAGYNINNICVRTRPEVFLVHVKGNLCPNEQNLVARVLGYEVETQRQQYDETPTLHSCHWQESNVNGTDVRTSHSWRCSVRMDISSWTRGFSCGREFIAFRKQFGSRHVCWIVRSTKHFISRSNFLRKHETVHGLRYF